MGVSPDITVSPSITVSPAVDASPDVSVSPGGIISLTISSPAVGTLFPRNVPITVSGTAVGSGALYATFDDGSSVGTGTADGGTFSLEVTALLADVSATELQIRRTSDDVVIGTLACVVVQEALWAPTAAGVGAVTTSSASAQAISGWAITNLTRADQGGGVYRLTESTDGAPASHYASITFSNFAGTYYDYTIRAVPIGRDRMFLNHAGQIYLDFAAGTPTPVTGDITAEWLGDYTFRIKSRKIVGSPVAYLYTASATSYSYQGTGVDCLDVSVSGATNGLTQTRAAEVADQSGTDAHLTNASAPTQKLYWDEAVGGVVVLHREAGRVSTLSTTNATVLAVASGDDPDFCVWGVWGGTGDDAELLHWSGAGSIADVPLYIDGAELKSRRHDGTTEDIQTYGSGLAAEVASACAVAIVGIGSRQRKLYINGVEKATITHADLVSATMTSCMLGHASATTPDQVTGMVALLAGASTYAALQAAVQSDADDYGIAA